MKLKLLSKLILILLLVSSIGIAQLQGEWEWQNPKPQGNRLTVMHVFSDGEILAVGANGTTMRSYNNGEDWEIEHYTLGPEEHKIDELKFIDENIGWALDRDGWDVYFTSDRGHNWEIRNSPAVYVYDLFVFDELEAWTTSTYHNVSHTTDGGFTWTNFPVSPAGEFTAEGIFFLNQNEGWAVGSAGILGGTDYGKIYHTSDGGFTWTLLFTSTVRFTAVGQVYFLNENIGWVGGTDAVIMNTTDGGQNWAIQYHRPNTNYAILDLYFFDSNNGIAVGTDGLIITTTNGGQTWEEKNSGTDAWIRDMFPVNNSTIWACGEFGLLIKSDDGGLSWSLVSNSVTNAYLSCVEFVDENNGWAGGPADGFLFKTLDGGENWVVADSGEHPIQVLQFLDPLNGYRIEWYGQTYHTRDGGNSWEFIDVLGRDGLYLNGCFADTSTGWLTWSYGLDGYLKKTTNGGRSWTVQLNTPDDWIFGIDFIDANSGWVSGQEGNIFNTTDGGLTWTQQTSGTSQPLYEIDFINEHIGFIAGAWGTLLKTTDGGSNWNPVNIPFAGTLYDVFFLDENSGWIIANDGVGRTLDGGLTWEQFLMPEGPSFLFDELHFVNADNGWLVGANGNILKFHSGTSNIINDEQALNSPSIFNLYQNYPNPFNPATKISWYSSVGSWQTLKIFDVLGNEVATLANEFKPAGNYEIEFNANHLPSGIYFYQLSASEFIETKKLTLIK